MTTIFLIGRVLFGGYFIYSGFNHFKNHAGLVGYAKMKGVPLASIAVYISGAMMLVGGLSVLLNRWAVPGMWLLVLFLIPTTLLMHAFWKAADPQHRMNETIQFTKNVALIGSLLIMIAIG